MMLIIQVMQLNIVVGRETVAMKRSNSGFISDCIHCNWFWNFFFIWFFFRWIKNNPKRLKIKYVLFFEGFLVLVKMYLNFVFVSLLLRTTKLRLFFSMLWSPFRRGEKFGRCDAGLERIKKCEMFVQAMQRQIKFL